MSPEPGIGLPSSITTSLVAVSVIFPILSLLTIALRFKARRLAGEHMLADDWWIIVSWLTAFSLSITVWVYGSIIGLNHMKLAPSVGLDKFGQCMSVTGALLQAAISAVKVSILLFYKRIFQVWKFKIAVWVAIVVVGLWDLAYVILVVVFAAKYDSMASKRTAAISQAATSIGLDIVVLTFPLPMIYGLKIATTRKLQLAFIFWLGAFCCVAAMARLILLKQGHDSGNPAEISKVIASQGKVHIFTILEPHCSVIAACLPCFGPLMRSYKKSRHSMTTRYSRSSTNASHPSDVPSSATRSYGKSPQIGELELGGHSFTGFERDSSDGDGSSSDNNNNNDTGREGLVSNGHGPVEVQLLAPG